MTWKTIPGFDNFEICEGGQVRNRKTGKVKKLTTNKSGKLYVTLHQNNKSTTKVIDNLIEELFDGQYVLPDKVKKLVDEAVRQGMLTEADICEMYDTNYVFHG